MMDQFTQPQELRRIADLLRSVDVLPSSIVFRVHDLPECIIKDRELYRLADIFRKSVETTIGSGGRTVLEMRAEAVLWRAYPRNPKDGQANETLQTLQQNARHQQVRAEAGNVSRVCPTY